MWLAYMVCHLAICHHAKLTQHDSEKWAATYNIIVNQLLIDSGFTLPAGALTNDAYSGLTVEAVYNLLSPDEMLGESYGEIRAPENQTPEDLNHEIECWEIAVDQAINLSNALGKPAGHFSRVVYGPIITKDD